MSTATQATGDLTTSRLKNTRSGNPRFAVTLQADNGDCIIGKTANDAMFTYGMPESGRATCRYYFTPSGQCVFSDIERAVATQEAA